MKRRISQRTQPSQPTQPIQPSEPSPVSLSLRRSVIVAFVLLGQTLATSAQSPVTAITAAYQTQLSLINLYIDLPIGLGAFGGCTGTSYTYTFSNGLSNQYKLSSFSANGISYNAIPANAATVHLRRVNNPNATGTRNIVYMETTAGSALACPMGLTLAFKPPYIDSMEALLGAGMLNQGTDNVFTNAANGDGNNNNIERVDVIFPTGLNTLYPTQAGFAIFDRGANYQHDPFRIAAITSLDAQGNPASFGPVKTTIGGNGSNNNGSWGHPTAAQGNKTFAAYVLRKDAADLRLRVSSNVNQEIGGVFYTFADLGVAAGSTLYGYALLGPDGTANPTSAQLLDLTNASVYPTTTTEAVGGGLDLVAVNTAFSSGGFVLLPLTINSFIATLAGGQAHLQWTYSNTNGNITATLQRSIDGISFQPIYTSTTNPNPSANPAGTYPDTNPSNSPSSSNSNPSAILAGTYLDTHLPSANTIYYRLCLTTPTGSTIYSQTLTLHPDDPTPTTWKVFPTILQQGQILNLSGLSDGQYILSFYNTTGSCQKTPIQILNGQASLSLSVANLPAGLYWLSLHLDGRPIPGNGKILIR